MPEYEVFGYEDEGLLDAEPCRPGGVFTADLTEAEFADFQRVRDAFYQWQDRLAACRVYHPERAASHPLYREVVDAG